MGRLEISEKEYRQLEYPSYSVLKSIDESGPIALKYKKELSGDSIDFGSLLDCMLLTKENFNDKFYSENIIKPTGQLLDLADYIVQSCNNYDLDISEYLNNNDKVLEIANNLNLFGNTKDYIKRIALFNTNIFWNYLMAIYSARGKTIISPEMNSEVYEAINILLNHENTRLIFNPIGNIEVYNQLILVEEINGVKVKVMIDKVIIDHDNKKIYLYDLKSTDLRSHHFKSNFFKFKYYLQGALYREVFKKFIIRELQLGYELDEFKFIVYSRQDKYPSIWNMGLEWHEKGLNGFDNVYNERENGVYQLLEDYLFYINNPEIRVNRKVAESKIIQL